SWAGWSCVWSWPRIAECPGLHGGGAKRRSSMQRILIASLGAMIVLSGSGVEADGTDPKYKDNPHIQALALGASKASSWIYTHDHPGSRHYADLKNEALLKEELELVR